MPLTPTRLAPHLPSRRPSTRPTRAPLSISARALLSLSALAALPIGCTPGAPPSAAQREGWPEEVVAYGGSDNLQRWLYEVQAYAQGAYAGAPAFAPLAPGMLAGALGVQSPQAIDLSAPIRWVIAAPSAPAASLPPPPPPKEVRTPTGELLYKSPPLPTPQAPWRALAAFKLTPLAVEGGALSAGVLSPTLWRAVEGQVGVYEPLTTQFDGKIYVKGQWLILSNDEALYARAADALLDSAARPLSPDLRVSVMLRQLRAHRAALDARSGGLLKLSDPALDDLFDSEAASLTLSATRGRVAIALSAPLRGPLKALVEPRLFEPTEALRPLQGNATGLIALNINGVSLKELAARVPELPPAVGALAPAPNLTLALSMNSAFELNGLLSGEEGARAPWLRALLRVLEGAVASARAKDPKAGSMRVSEAEAIDGLRVERLSVGDLPPANTQGATLIDWRAQVAEGELLHTPEATLMSFGPRSHARLAAWRELSKGGGGGLLKREDLKPLLARCPRMAFALYLSPLAVERLGGATPTAEALGGDEGVSLALCARGGEGAGEGGEVGEALVAELSLPVAAARRVVALVLGGGLRLVP